MLPWPPATHQGLSGHKHQWTEHTAPSQDGVPGEGISAPGTWSKRFQLQPPAMEMRWDNPGKCIRGGLGCRQVVLDEAAQMGENSSGLCLYRQERW